MGVELVDDEVVLDVIGAEDDGEILAGLCLDLGWAELLGVGGLAMLAVAIFQFTPEGPAARRRPRL